MKYFYDYFARRYRDRNGGRLLPAPAAMFQGIEPEDVKSCRRTLKNSFEGYREGRNAEALERLLGEYREYVSGCHDEGARDRYNAFVYRHMVEIHVGSRAIAARLGVARETALNYINRSLDEMLALCMGIPAAGEMPEENDKAVGMLTRGSRLFGGMAGEYVLCLFPGKGERAAVKKGRRLTEEVMGRFTDAARAYSRYCNDGYTRIDTDVRKAEILERCLAGIPAAAIAEEYGCSASTIYADIRENERRLAAMLFCRDEGGTTDSDQVYIAGEDGPELIISGGGDTVFPASETDRIISAVSGGRGNPQITEPTAMRSRRGRAVPRRKSGTA